MPLLVLVISRGVASCIQSVPPFVAPNLCTCPKMEKSCICKLKIAFLSTRFLYCYMLNPYDAPTLTLAKRRS